MMFRKTRTSSNIIKSFLPLFYISKCFGCNLFPLPRVLNPTNVKINLRAIDVIICSVHIGLSFFVTIPLIKTWEQSDSTLRKELEAMITYSSVVTLRLIGTAVNYGYVFTCLFIIINDMINASAIRNILLSFMNIDELVMAKQLINYNSFT